MLWQHSFLIFVITIEMCLHLPNVCKLNILWPNQTRPTSYLKVPVITDEDIILTGLELCISDEEEVWSEEWTCFLLDGQFSLTSIGKGTKNLPEVQTGLEAFSVSQIQRALQALGFLLPVRIAACLRFAQTNLWPLQSFPMGLLYITVFTLCVFGGQRCVPSP